MHKYATSKRDSAPKNLERKRGFLKHDFRKEHYLTVALPSFEISETLSIWARIALAPRVSVREK